MITLRNQSPNIANDHGHKSFALVHVIRTDWLRQTGMTRRKYPTISQMKRDKSDDCWRVLTSTDEQNINKNR